MKIAAYVLAVSLIVVLFSAIIVRQIQNPQTETVISAASTQESPTGFDVTSFGRQSVSAGAMGRVNSVLGWFCPNCCNKDFGGPCLKVKPQPCSNEC